MINNVNLYIDQTLIKHALILLILEQEILIAKQHLVLFFLTWQKANDKIIIIKGVKVLINLIYNKEFNKMIVKLSVAKI